MQPGDPAPRRRPGRPPPDLRPILEAVLWKISHREPWYCLPETAPAWQTCYRYYRLWQRSGLLDRVFHVLYLDLVERGGFDLPALLASGAVSFDHRLGHWTLNFDPVWNGTWQLETARLFLALAAARLKSRSAGSRPHPNRRRPALSALKVLGLSS